MVGHVIKTFCRVTYDVLPTPSTRVHTPPPPSPAPPSSGRSDCQTRFYWVAGVSSYRGMLVSANAGASDALRNVNVPIRYADSHRRASQSA